MNGMLCNMNVWTFEKFTGENSICLFVPQAVKLDIPVLGELSDSDIKSQLLTKAPDSAQE